MLPKKVFMAGTMQLRLCFNTEVMVGNPGTKNFKKSLNANQHPEGYWEYPSNFHGKFDDKTSERVYATTLCALMLTVYYRYLPSTKSVPQKKKVVEVEEELNLIE